MASVLHEVAVITPYTTAKTFPLLGALDDHATIKHESDNVDLHWFLQPGDHVSSRADQSTGSHPKVEHWHELPSCIRSVDSSDFAFSTVSSLTLSSDPCLSDVSWGNRELCSTKYDHDDFEGVHFIPVTGTDLLPDLTQALPGEMDTGIGTSLTDTRSQRCQDAKSSEIEHLLAKIAEDICALRTEPETKTSLADHSETPKVSLAPNSLESSLFVTAMSHISDDDFYRTAASHFDHDDDSSSAFSSCRVSRSSSQCDLHEGAKHSETHASERFGSHELPTSRLRKPLPTIKSVTPMPTMFTPPQKKEGRKLTTLLSVDLESCKSYDTCGSSGYCDSPTASSVFSDYSEFSCLNPLSKPFVPRAWAGVNHEEDPCTRQALGVESFAADSGIEQSHLNASHRLMAHPPSDIDDGRNLESLAQNSTGIPNKNTNAEEFPPYLCSLKHGKEFTPVLDFSSSNLPEACRTIKHVSAVKAIAQRVVKLRVRKAFSLFPESPTKSAFPSSSVLQPRGSNSPVFDHYGTGFVFDVDAEHVRIRTHRKVVGSADEAAHTRVFFSISTAEGVIDASCAGEKDGFSLKSNSESAVLTCRTPPDLLSHLHVFQELPMQTRTSFFNDSCYYSDLSPDCSISDHEEARPESDLPCEGGPPWPLLLETPSKQLTYADVVSCKQKAELLSCGNQIPVDLTDHNSPNKRKAHVVNSNHHNMESSNINVTNLKFQPSISVFDLRVRQAFESAAVADDRVVCRGRAQSIHPKYEVDTPLVLNERWLEKSSSKACPYVDEKTFGSNGQYSYFSSFAGDVLSTLQLRSGDATEWSHPWGYESLVYAQNHQRDSYNRTNNLPQACRRQSLSQGSTNSRDTFSSHSGIIAAARNTCSQSAMSESSEVNCSLLESDTFRELSSVGAYLESWDKNLLNLDDSLNPLPEYDPVVASSEPCDIESSNGNINIEPVNDYEILVDAILRDDTEVSCIKGAGHSCCRKNCLSGEHAPQNSENEVKSHPTYALVISHPHGGPKVVSVGQLSRHHHIGGDLYDAPTCMGSCGAPVVFLSEASEGPLVAHLVHGGTTRETGFPTGIGFSFFI